ncbi:MAG: hypothetical protein F6J94_17045 [Moorea sp. SIO1F2]|uniref:hypothetical protein n=1 Tax=unclassified Moorena TaxID=2683338 RepID=UPI0013B5C713|nr:MULTISPECIES: hypothetical protein [unclassified Moorena]NEO06982.1 hypothetical protein [Moorena sp. SIO3I8]NEO61006.1 hypothetical protein [Moorena sp. SIO4G2]NEO18794.1 hypothetical protein [Moorena sp. SIO4A5]NEP21426.1 hypothetical protein [Moorena sp. SIO3I6]NEQ56785.1 hypothetical protein [Moorena sp. SIO4A1]
MQQLHEGVGVGFDPDLKNLLPTPYSLLPSGHKYLSQGRTAIICKTFARGQILDFAKRKQNG